MERSLARLEATSVSTRKVWTVWCGCWSDTAITSLSRISPYTSCPWAGNLDLDMIAFLMATLVSLEEGGKVTEEQRRWWRLAARAEQFQLTSRTR